MQSNQIAVQLYTVRDFCKSASELAQTAGRLRAIGYETAEVAGVSADISPEEIRRILSEAGITICSAHESSDLIRLNPLAVVERLKAMGVDHAVYPYPAGVDFSDPASIKAMVSDLDAAGTVLREHGCSLSYHNHAIEFSRLGNETLLNYIARATSPETLQFELDTYWVQFGGCNPVEWCGKAAGRITVLHCKDYGFGANNQPFFAEIGYGNLDFPAIISAAESAGCKWFVVEQDACPGDPFVSLEKSYKTMRECLCS
ncbi:MAG: sugar phosphate isomerase/epimerase [Verrucomicrobiaceae bacterium]|nr:MAG: sugar phosphate isomerase/epimerase [Verrucomicrobiaceae bacterium]